MLNARAVVMATAVHVYNGECMEGRGRTRDGTHWRCGCRGPVRSRRERAVSVGLRPEVVGLGRTPR